MKSFKEFLNEAKGMYGGISADIWKKFRIKAKEDRSSGAVSLEGYPLFISQGDTDKNIGVFDERSGDLLFQGSKAKVLKWIEKYLDSNEVKLYFTFRENTGRYDTEGDVYLLTDDKTDETVMVIEAGDRRKIEGIVKKYHKLGRVADGETIKIPKDDYKKFLKDLKSIEVSDK